MTNSTDTGEFFSGTRIGGETGTRIDMVSIEGVPVPPSPLGWPGALPHDDEGVRHGQGARSIGASTHSIHFLKGGAYGGQIPDDMYSKNGGYVGADFINIIKYKSEELLTPRIFWWAILGSNQGPTD